MDWVYLVLPSFPGVIWLFFCVFQVVGLSRTEVWLLFAGLFRGTLDSMRNLLDLIGFYRVFTGSEFRY